MITPDVVHDRSFDPQGHAVSVHILIELLAQESYAFYRWDGEPGSSGAPLALTPGATSLNPAVYGLLRPPSALDGCCLHWIVSLSSSSGDPEEYRVTIVARQGGVALGDPFVYEGSTTAEDKTKVINEGVRFAAQGE